MEEFLLDISDGNVLRQIGYLNYSINLGAIGDSFCVMCDSAGMDAYECVYSDRVEPEALETVFLQNSSEKQKEIVNIPAGFTLEEFVFKNVYGHKTHRC